MQRQDLLPFSLVQVTQSWETNWEATAHFFIPTLDLKLGGWGWDLPVLKILKAIITTDNQINSLPIDNNFLCLINHLTSDGKTAFFFLPVDPEHLRWFYLTNKSIILNADSCILIEFKFPSKSSWTRITHKKINHLFLMEQNMVMKSDYMYDTP